MSKIIDRYSGAVHATSLKPTPESMAEGTNPVATASRIDILGAAGLAAKRRPLAMALLRLFAGDNHAARDVVQLLAHIVVAKAWEWDQVAVSFVEAEDIGRMVLAWHRDGVCRVCGGHGFKLIEGAPTLSEQPCPACKGAGKVPFDAQFTMERLILARWLRSRIEREQGLAGDAVMQALAQRLEP